MKKILKWMEDHSVFVGLLGLAFGAVGTWLYGYVTEKAEEAASNRWTSEVNTWRSQQQKAFADWRAEQGSENTQWRAHRADRLASWESECREWRTRQDAAQDQWRERREDRLANDSQYLLQKSAEALEIVADVKVRAELAEKVSEEIKTLSQETKKGLEELNEASVAIKKNTDGLAGQVKTLLAKDSVWKEELLATIAKNHPPVGTIVAWPSDIPPVGNDWKTGPWRKCDGTPLDPAQYADLVKALNGQESPYGWESGKIKLPNFTGRFLRGTGGKANGLGVPQSDLIKQHTHDLPHTIPIKGSNDGGAGGNNGTVKGTTMEPARTNKVSGSAGGNETRPVNYSVHWIIRVR